MRLCAYSWKLPAYSGALVLTVDNFSFFAYSWSFFAYSFSFFTYNWSFFAYSWSFFAYSWSFFLRRALRNCKQRSLTVSKKAPTVSKKLPPVFKAWVQQSECCCHGISSEKQNNHLFGPLPPLFLPRVCKPWFPNPGWRYRTKQKLNEVKERYTRG